ncbi:MAG: sigma-E factor regulatory protein RseB domain-containing protein [Carbonactinosporaceae bacterium]
MSALAPFAGTVAALTLLAGPPSGVDSPPSPATTGDDVRALLLLDRAASAPRVTAYYGVQFVSSWGPHLTRSYLVDVNHVPGEGTAVRARGTSLVPGGEIFRSMSTGEPPSELSTSGSGPVGLLARNFSVSVAGTSQVAGRPVDIVEARRGRGNTIAARFWLDQDTGLMLRREVFDAQGVTVRASAFVELSMGSGPSMSHPPPLLPDVGGTTVDGRELSYLRGSGWNCPHGLPPGLELYAAHRVQDSAGPVIHLSYSDGLSTISVFEQKGRLDTERLAGYESARVAGAPVYVRDGVQRSIVWQAEGTVYAVLADAPPESVHAAVAALPHERAETGLLARLVRGLGRVASWFNPFG